MNDLSNDKIKKCLLRRPLRYFSKICNTNFRKKYLGAEINSSAKCLSAIGLDIRTLLEVILSQNDSFFWKNNNDKK